MMQAVDPRRAGGLRFLLGLLILVTPLWTWPQAEARSPVPASVVAALDAPHVPGEIIVRFREEVSEEERRQALLDGGAGESKAFDEINAKLAVTAPEDMAYVLAELGVDPRVEYAEPNYLMKLDIMPDDPEFSQQWALNNEGQITGDEQGYIDADIDAPEAWEITTGNPEVIVAVIDSGVEFTHPDFGGDDRTNPRMWTNPGETCAGCRTDGIDNDGNSYVDDWRGWDFANEDGSPRDDNGHGSHVAGILGAQGNNGTGGAGIAWNVRLMALKTFGAGGTGETELGVEAVLYAVEKGASVINASWGSIFPSLALRDAIEYAGQEGVVFVAAGGNDGLNTDLVGHFPSALDIPGMISVGATNSRDELASFSNYGLRTVDLAAPGQNIYSTWSLAEIGTDYRYISGTSMATPMVTGVAALIKSIHPNATPLGIKNLILNSVDPLPSLEGLISSGGRLNAHTAVSCQNEPQAWVDRPVPGFAAVPGEPVEVRVLASNCAVPDGVDVTANAAGEPIELTPQGDGTYLGTFIPSDAANLSITAEARIGEQVDTHSVPGEVVRNYQFRAVPLDWLDATTGTRIEYQGEDDFEVPVELPFAFTFYNREVTEAVIGENGLIGFAGTRVTNPLNSEIPDVLAPNGFVAPFWDNFDLEDGGEIWYATVGEAPNRRFVVSWIDIENRVQGSSTGINPTEPDGATFQAVLEEATGDIIFQYLDVNFGLSTIDNGQGATIGVEHYSGTVGRQFSYNDASLGDYEGSRGIRFTLKAPNQPEITTGSLPHAPAGLPYLQHLEVADGEPPYTWSVVEGELPPGLALDAGAGIIAGTPYVTGSFTFTLEVTDSAGATGRQFFTIIVDQGYQIQDDTFSWIDPADGGERLPFERDDQAETVSLPFSFDYYGQAFEEVQISTNGYLVFGDDRATRFTNTELPNPREPNGVVAVYWDDISPQEQGGVWYRTTGEAPNRQFVVGWVDVPRFAAEDTGTFEVILEEGSNDIIFQYLDLDFDDETYDFGISATIGVENHDGTVGAQFSNDEVIPEQYIGQTAIRFVAGSPPEPVMNVDTLPVGAVDTPYLSLLSAYGGAPPYTWSVTGGALPPGLELDPVTGVLSGAPELAGEFTFTAQATDSGDPANSTTAEYTIVVMPSYAITEGPFEWIDPRNGGQPVDLDDEEARTVALPFTFNFYGEEYSEIWISTKGYITIGPDRRQSLINRPIPYPDQPNGFVAALWDDLTPDDVQGVWVHMVGEAPNRRAVVTWIDTPRFNEIGAATFQIILEEGANRIILQYQDAMFEDERYDYGASATIGVEAPNGLIGTEFSFDQPSLSGYEGTTAVIFEPVTGE